MSFGSFFAALSGLQANASRLSVIGNNLANVNTIGFKSSRVIFHDFFAGSSFNGAGNPAQVGLGTDLASIDPIFNQGSLQTTGILTDMAVQGRGFFVLRDPSGGRSFARAGNFAFNEDGTLVSSGGEIVQGYTTRAADGTIETSGALADIKISSGMIAEPRVTSTLSTSINLDGDATTGGSFSTTLSVYDSKGSVHDLTMNFTKTAAGWDYDLQVPGGDVAGGSPGDPPVSLASGSIAFDGAGLLTAPASNVTFTTPAWANGANAQTVSWDIYDPGTGEGLITGYTSPSAVSSVNQDGYASGELRSLLIDQDGKFSGIFSNGVNIELAQLATATFNNERGLLRNGQNTFLETNGSGSATIGAPNTGGRGATVSGSLELSNVDITEQFTDLIISQRGYQANSRIITTSDEVIQESLNLKR